MLWSRTLYDNCIVRHVLLHTRKTSETTFSVKDVGFEVPKSIETRCSMQAIAGDDEMQQCGTPYFYILQILKGVTFYYCCILSSPAFCLYACMLLFFSVIFGTLFLQHFTENAYNIHHLYCMTSTSPVESVVSGDISWRVANTSGCSLIDATSSAVIPSCNYMGIDIFQ